MTDEHWFQAKVGYHQPIFSFDHVEAGIAQFRTDTGMNTSAEDFLDFVSRWDAQKWNFAVRGKAGDAHARTFRDEWDVLRSAHEARLPRPYEKTIP